MQFLGVISMSTQQNNIVKMPVDLTPAQRAGLKLYGHFAIIALFNGLMAGIVLITNDRFFTWQTVALVVLGQATLALLDALKKYYTASNQLPLSTLFDLARQEAATKVPAVQYTPNQQAINDAVNNLLLQTDTSPNAAQNATKPVVYTATSTEPAAQGATPTAASATPVYPPIPDNVATLNTLPNISAISQAEQ
jgi:hypothetical protein